MPQDVIFNDYKAGWIPSDNAKMGRKNGFLRMDNVQLTDNGAITLIPGTQVQYSYDAPPTDIDSQEYANSAVTWAATSAGSVYHNGTNIINGSGSTTRTGFGYAFDATLIASGRELKKYITGTLKDLGIAQPQAPVAAAAPAQYTGYMQPDTYMIRDWTNYVPGTSSNLDVKTANFITTEGWSVAGPGAYLGFDNGPSGNATPPSIAVAGLTGNSGTTTFTLTYPSTTNLSLATDSPDNDVFSLYVRGQYHAPGYATTAVIITYHAGTGSAQWTVPFNWSDPANNNVWKLIQCRRSDFNATSSFSWSAITSVTMEMDWSSTSAPIEFWFSGMTFDGIQTIASTPPALYNSGTPGVVTFNNRVDYRYWNLSFTNIVPVDFSSPGDGQQTDNDVMSLQVEALAGDLSTITSISLEIELAASANFDPVSDHYIVTRDLTANPISTGSIYNFRFLRSDFSLESPLSRNWTSVVGFTLTFQSSASITLKLDLSQVPLVAFANKSLCFYGGTNSLNGTYQWAELAGDLGSYNLSNSPFGVYSNVLTLDNQPATITPTLLDINGDALDVNQIQIFRSGGNLEQPYQIKLLTAPFTGSFVDEMSDINAQATDIVPNLSLTSIAQLNDTVLEIIGPIEGRWFYFTQAGFMYPSDINDPGLIDSTIAVRVCGSTDEQFFWAVKVAEGVVLVGTAYDVYILSGTFVSYPDGSIDIQYKPLVCQHPPICRDATFDSGRVYYMSSDGWRFIDSSGACTNITAPNIDLLYQGQSRYGYTAPDLSGAPGTSRFPCVVTNNKLYCSVNNRFEVYDFSRNYWRTFNYNIGVTCVARSINGDLLAGTSDNKSRTFEYNKSTLVDGTTKQTISLLTPVFDGGDPRRRNDIYTLKTRFNVSAGDSISITLIDDQGNIYIAGNFVGTGNDQEIVSDLLSKIPNPIYTWQYQITGNLTSFALYDIGISLDNRPIQLTSLRILSDNLGSAAKKRLRMWPIVIDTLGNTVTFTPTNDNAQGTSSTFSTLSKQTVPIYYNSDIFATDYGMVLTGGPFEFYSMGSPEIVQVMPVPKEFDQVGPTELFRYGKISEIRLRIYPLAPSPGSSVSIPFTIYFDDYNTYSSAISVLSQQEATYYLKLPKGMAGSILRIELGPTPWPFLRYYVQVLVAPSGKDTTDGSTWINV